MERIQEPELRASFQLQFDLAVEREKMKRLQQIDGGKKEVSGASAGQGSQISKNRQIKELYMPSARDATQREIGK